jgi:hypothetical protein
MLSKVVSRNDWPPAYVCLRPALRLQAWHASQTLRAIPAGGLKQAALSPSRKICAAMTVS